MKIAEFSDFFVRGEVTCEGGVFMVRGKALPGSVVEYHAAEPRDLRLSISGSALPFPNEEVAFGGHNSGSVRPDGNGNFQFMLYNPNSYYTCDLAVRSGQGKLLVQPALYLNVRLQNGSSKKYTVKLGRALPLRGLTNMPNKPVRSTGRNNPVVYV